MQDVLQSFEDNYCVPGDGAHVRAEFRWESDGSKGIRALNEVFHLEALRVVKEEGCFIGVGLGGTREKEGEELLGDIMPNSDRHGSDWSDLVKCKAGLPNMQIIDQFYIMKDRRSDSPYVPIRNSGYRITRTVIDDPDRPGCPLFVV